MTPQRAKKVVSDSPGLVDFAIGLVNFILNLPDGQVKFLRNSNYRRTVKSILLIKKFLGLAEMTFGLVYAALSLPEWQAVKITFFAPCSFTFIITPEQKFHISKQPCNVLFVLTPMKLLLKYFFAAKN